MHNSQTEDIKSRNIACRSPFRDKMQGLVARDNPVAGRETGCAGGKKNQKPSG